MNIFNFKIKAFSFELIPEQKSHQTGAGKSSKKLFHNKRFYLKKFNIFKANFFSSFNGDDTFRGQDGDLVAASLL